MKYLIFAAVIGLGLATPSFAQQNAANPSAGNGAAASSSAGASSMEKSGVRHKGASRPARRVSRVRSGASASREQNAAEQRETARLNEQQLQQATHAR